MTRNEFIRCVASELQTTIPETKFWVESIFEILADKILIEDKVIIKNFGTFKRKIRKPKKRWDCNEGRTVIDPERTAVVFSPSDFLEQQLEDTE